MNALRVGVGVGGTTIKTVLTGDDGIAYGCVDPAPIPRAGAGDVVRMIVSMAKPLLALAGPGAALGVCAPGIVDEERGMGVFSANLGRHRAPLRDPITHLYGCPAAFGHDVCSRALAETRWGVGVPSCLYVIVGTGVASGLVLDGHLPPPHPWTGEIRQVDVTHPATGVTAPPESVSPASAIAGRAADAGIASEGTGVRDVEDVAITGSQETVRILDKAMGALRHVLSIVAHRVGSIPVVLGGGSSRGGEFIYGPSRRALTPGSTVAPPPALLRIRLGADSQVLDAAALSLKLEEVYV